MTALDIVKTEMEQGMALPKCQKCGCMEGELQNLATLLPSIGTDDSESLAGLIHASLEKMRPVQYACLGCEHCYPAAAQNAFGQVYPSLCSSAVVLSCELRSQEEGWPPVVGEYFLLDKTGPVAVSTLASVELPEELARRKPAGLAIAGKTETENIGIDKVIKNVISNPALRYLIVAGLEPKGHSAGQTLLALAEKGVDQHGRVIGSKGKRPVLRNVSTEEIKAFREQVQLVDMIGCVDPGEICTRIEGLARQSAPECGCSQCGCTEAPIPLSPHSMLIAAESDTAIKMDKAGYFVIVPLVDRGVINVEQYAYNHTLLRVIEGHTARAIYRLVIENGWVTELSHAAYLGKELGKAELSLQNGYKYIQDGA